MLSLKDAQTDKREQEKESGGIERMDAFGEGVELWIGGGERGMRRAGRVVEERKERTSRAGHRELFPYLVCLSHEYNGGQLAELYPRHADIISYHIIEGWLMGD